MPSFNFSFVFASVSAGRRWWLVLALLASLVQPVLAQTPQLPVRRSGLETAPLQTKQLDVVRPGDTARVFSLQNLAELVYANHPIVKQAALLSD